MPEQVPLTTLLTWTWIALTMETDNAFEAAGSERVGRCFRISLPMWTNGLRFIDADGITVDELHTRAGAACNIGGLERWGWISVGEVGAGRRDGYGTHRGVKGDTVLRPTRAGAYGRQLWPRVIGAVEQRWRERFGGDVIDGLQDALSRNVTPTPWSPPEVNPSDGFRTNVVGGGENGVGSCDAGRGGNGPLAAQLGRVLTAFTVDHEREAEVSLPLGANVLRVIGPDVVRTRDLPARSGVSKEGISMATNYLERRGLAAAVPAHAIRLTPAGLDALDGYRHWSARAQNPGMRAALEAVVAEREALAAGLVPPEGCWRGEKPYLAQTRRLVADPTATLPWHPMVLHRGGWPDGS